MTVFIANIVSITVAALFVFALVRTLKRAFQPQIATVLDSKRKDDYKIILILYLLTTFLIFAAGIITQLFTEGADRSFTSILYNATSRWDAHHYMDIAQKGYVNYGESRLYIVFFPLFPALIKIGSFITGEYLIASLIISNVCFFFALLAVYNIAVMDYGRETALRAVKYILIFPSAFFFRYPFTESIFLLFSALTVYYSRKHMWAAAGIAAFLCSLSRMPGVLAIVPIVVEAFYFAKQNKKPVLTFFKSAAWALLPFFGIFIYLLINKLVTDDWFKFMQYQKEHWYQQFAVFTHSVKTIFSYLLNIRKPVDIPLWLTQALVILFFIWLIVTGSKKLRVSHSFYSLACFFTMLSVTWLLSAPRYLMTIFPAFFTLAMIIKKPRQEYILTAVSIAGLVVLTVIFSTSGPIY